MAFTGFSTRSISFLKELAANNNKDWFEQNRTIYEQHILEPLKQLVTGLGSTMHSIDSEIDITPQVNRTISRIYRDTRFSMDKSPLRTEMWISFKRSKKIWGNVPEFYFYFTPEEYQYGMGYYAATSKNMEQLRQKITSVPSEFKRIIDQYNTQHRFILKGEEYKKRIPNEFPTEFQPWFQKRNLYMVCEKHIDNIFYSAELENDICKGFDLNAQLYNFLIQSLFEC